MRVTTIGRYTPEPGTLVEWRAAPAAVAAVAKLPRHPAPPSFNQRFHLETAVRGAAGRDAGTWLAFAFDLPGRADIDVLEAVLVHWIRRHETLRSGFSVPEGGGPDDVERRVLPPERVALVRSEAGRFDSARHLAAHLRRRFDEECRPLSWPSYLPGAIVRPDRTTLFCGFDHCDVDGYSLALAVHELGEIHQALSRGRPVELPETGSFVEYCAEERSPVPAPARDDPAMRPWRELARACGGAPPAFPLDLGVPPGQVRPQLSECRRLLDAPATADLEEACRAAGGSLFTGLLAAAGLAARRLGAAADGFRLLTPLHTRTDPRWRAAVGWFTRVAPIAFDVDVEERFPETLAAAHQAFRAALATVAVPFPAVLAALEGGLTRTRDDVFMLSYIDYRRFPGADRYPDCDPWHISNETVADDAQFWVSRTRDGLFLRARCPDTPLARANLSAYLAEWCGVLASARPA
ncbi:condensation domain-containing protein [Marinitenerispora sediminis]|uniref:Condensation protein n=1 Tax=Marinitenerispora sediminis TaxID=1931232 RepID=A0A368T4C8_9ACTN|nr:condensation domain-containing protein [Marinitenerispora sediminis]RCV51959.1 condensation protein [Marinitenerispora sediminis]RCV55401.1 condensation protein [Marinitenerispora sediminis]RCV58196.1 condensation protein [Marinitenerispora sediminis]